jgi:hypothetical protein
VGTVASMGISEKDKIIGWSDDKTQAMIIGANGKMEVRSTGFKASASSTGTKSTAQQQIVNEIKAAAQNWVPLKDLIATYSGVPNAPSANEIYAIYNTNSKWGAAKESGQELAKWGISTKDEGKTPITITNKDGSVTTIPQ